MRRSALQTVRRVAELRQTTARAAVAAAVQAHVDATCVAAERQAALEATELTAGTAGELVAAAATRSRLALAGTQARRDVADRELRRREAVGAWTAAARRAGVLTEACARQQAEVEAARLLVAQRTLDDLAARRRSP